MRNFRSIWTPCRSFQTWNAAKFEFTMNLLSKFLPRIRTDPQSLNVLLKVLNIWANAVSHSGRWWDYRLKEQRQISRRFGADCEVRSISLCSQWEATEFARSKTWSTCSFLSFIATTFNEFVDLMGEMVLDVICVVEQGKAAKYFSISSIHVFNAWREQSGSSHLRLMLHYRPKVLSHPWSYSHSTHDCGTLLRCSLVRSKVTLWQETIHQQQRLYSTS